MEHKLKKFAMVFGFVVTSISSHAAPQQPKLTVTTEETKATVQWSPVTGANNYSLFYAPHPALTPINSIPLADKTDFIAELLVGASYAVAIKAHGSSGESNYSNVEVVRIENPNTVIIKRTGQKKSFNEQGDVVADRSIKDDGYYQTGVAQSYTRDDTKEIVTDNVTGLMWQDDSEAKTVLKPWMSPVEYNLAKTTGDYSNTSGATLTTYCANFNLR